ncbi:hypothetical protein Tco_0640165, partial [Tanacetum coccineum]
GDVPASEGDVDIQDDVDIDGLSRMASEALGPDQTTVPLRRKRSAYRRARTAFSTPAFEQFQAHLSAGPSVAADKGKAPMPDLDIPAEFIAEDAQARKRFEEEQASARLVQQLQAEDLAQADVPIVSEQRAQELDELMLRMTETDCCWELTAIKERKKRALADLRYRALKGKPLKQSEVTQMMRNLVKNQWCAAHNGTITMKVVKAMTKQQLIEEYEFICKRLEKDRLLSAQYNLFRPKPAISEPPSKRQRVDSGTSPPSGVPAATTQPADDPDSAGGGTSHPAGSTFGAPVSDSTVPTSAAMDSAGSHHELGISPFADSADRGINGFFLDSDEDEQIGMSRVAADPDSDDEVLAEILFRGQYISGAGVVVVDKLPDDEIVDPRVKVEPISESASSPPRSRRKHHGVRSDDSLWERPVEDFLSSERKSTAKVLFLPETVATSCLSDFNLLCQSLISDDVEDFWRTQDECVVSSWKLYPRSSVHVLDLTNGKTVYMFVDNVYPIWATLLGTDVYPTGLTVTTHIQSDLCCLGMLFRQFKLAYENPMIVLHLLLYWKLLLRDVAASFDSAVHRVHAVSFDAAVAAKIGSCCSLMLLLAFSSSIPADNVPAGSSSSIPADYVSAGHVLVSADRDRIC